MLGLLKVKIFSEADFNAIYNKIDTKIPFKAFVAFPSQL